MENFLAKYWKSLSVVSLLGLSTWIYNRWGINRRIYFNDRTRLDGQTVIITGANAGIGYETAKDFLRRGGRVILACRNLSKGREAMANLRLETSCSSSNVRLLRLDLSSFRSIRTFVEEFQREETRLDLLICNAGLTRSKEKFTEDQFDFVLQSNYLGHFLLVELLREMLVRSAPSRVIHLSSDLHRLVKTAPDLSSSSIFRQEEDRSLMGPYPLSKLFQLQSTNILRQEYRAQGVEMVCVTPGWVSTSMEDPLVSQLPLLVRPLYLFFDVLMRWIFSRTVSKGAETVIFAALDPSISSSTTNETKTFYYQNCRPSTLSSLAADEVLSARLVELTRQTID